MSKNPARIEEADRNSAARQLTTGIRTEAGRTAVAELLADPGRAMLTLDFDGTLAPIVSDPAQAYADPRAVAALSRLGPLLGSVVLITGRPVQLALRLGGFRDAPGLESLTILGQYGFERWDAATDRLESPPIPAGIALAAAELPRLLADVDLTGVRVEDKGRALAVHTRELADPAAYARLADPLRELASRAGLVLEAGRNVWELRAPGMDKGIALRALVAERRPGVVVFAGDDLGDLPAYEELAQLRTAGTGESAADSLRGLLIYSASAEEDALAQLADLTVAGPSGVADWLNLLADLLGS